MCQGVSVLISKQQPERLVGGDYGVCVCVCVRMVVWGRGLTVGPACIRLY